MLTLRGAGGTWSIGGGALKTPRQSGIDAVVLVGGWMGLRDSSLVRVSQVRVTGASGFGSAAVRSALDAAARDMTTLNVDEAALRSAVADVRKAYGLSEQKTLRREGAPIPMKPRKRWDDGRNVVLAGDASGVVAPASGEGIYYAMLGGRLAADAVTVVDPSSEGAAAGDAAPSAALSTRTSRRSPTQVSVASRIASLVGKWRNSAPCVKPIRSAMAVVVISAGFCSAAKSTTACTVAARRSSADRC